MRLLWITNVELPSIAEHFGRQVVVGGWMISMAKQLSKKKDFQLYVLSPSGGEKYVDVMIGSIHYFSFDSLYCKKDFISLFMKIEPDLIHIWGTEYAHTLCAVKAAEHLNINNRILVSIQGLVSVYAEHYFSTLPYNIIRKKTFKEFIGKPNIIKSQQDMKNQGQNEIEVIKSIKHCIGRTDWDYACVKLINSDIKYHFCNETLRDSFYKVEWKLDKCEKNSIFFSQAHYPIKGLHIMLHALSLVKNKYPDVKLRVIGNPLKDNSFLARLKLSTYQKYILELIHANGLESNIEWLGYLSEKDMLNQYCKANVFVCSSSIENSSNSVGEAMLLGMPVIASDVGGIKSFMEHRKEGIIFQESAYYMLAANIQEIFENPDYAIKLGNNARARALKTHDRENNLKRLIKIYNEVLEDIEC